MITSTAALTWPAPHDAATQAPALVTPSGASVGWELHRRGSMAPRDLGFGFAALCMASLGIGIAFWWLGFGVVLAFAGLELLVIATALLVHARHVGDGESVVLRDRVLEVGIRHGSTVTRLEIGLEWLRVEMPVGDRGPVVIHGPGQHVRVGLQVPFQRRLAFAKDLRRAVLEARHSAPATPQFWS